MLLLEFSISFWKKSDINFLKYYLREKPGKVKYPKWERKE
jgi:hypothetical protein